MNQGKLRFLHEGATRIRHVDPLTIATEERHPQNRFQILDLFGQSWLRDVQFRSGARKTKLLRHCDRCPYQPKIDLAHGPSTQLVPGGRFALGRSVITPGNNGGSIFDWTLTQLVPILKRPKFPGHCPDHPRYPGSGNGPYGEERANVRGISKASARERFPCAA